MKLARTSLQIWLAIVIASGCSVGTYVYLDGQIQTSR